MDEMFSEAEDCYELAIYLGNKLGGRIGFCSGDYQEVLDGIYHCFPFEYYNSFSEYRKNKIMFNFKFCKDQFLRLSIENGIYPQTMGHKLAVLSDFYKILFKQFGQPTCFYTIKDDPNESLSLQWSFINKEEEIQKFKNDSYFDDGKIDQLIIIGESFQLNDVMIDYLVDRIELPLELLGLVNDNIEDFIKFKTGKDIKNVEKTKPGIDSSILSQKQLILKKKINLYY